MKTTLHIKYNSMFAIEGFVPMLHRCFQIQLLETHAFPIHVKMVVYVFKMLQRLHYFVNVLQTLLMQVIKIQTTYHYAFIRLLSKY